MSAVLTVVIVNWNTRAFLSRCLKSVLDDSHSIAISIIVVDNASTDDSVEMVQRNFPQVVLVQNKTNVGFVKANNQGLAMATGEWVLFLNPDTEIQPGALQTMLAFGQSHPSVGAIGPQLLNGDGSLQNSVFQFPNPWRLFLEYIVSSSLAARLERPRAVRDPVRAVDVIRGACLLARRDLVRDCGGMNERIFMYAEETDLCYKIARRGFARMLLADCRVIHHERQSVRQQDEWLMRYHYVRSTIIFVAENYPEFLARICIDIIKVGLYTRRALAHLQKGASRRIEWTKLIEDLASIPGWKKGT